MSTTTYIVKKNNRRIPNKVFATYDQARSWVRRKLRSMRESPGMFSLSGRIDSSDLIHRTPSLEKHGYSISRVEG